MSHSHMQGLIVGRRYPSYLARQSLDRETRIPSKIPMSSVQRSGYKCDNKKEFLKKDFTSVLNDIRCPAVFLSVLFFTS